MAEVTRQLGPLEAKVGKLSNSIERLYNSNGGPPGFLQTARQEDNGRFEMIFSMLEEFKQELAPLKKFMSDHIATEQQKQRDDAVKDAAFSAKIQESDRRMKRWFAIIGLALSMLTVLMNLRSCGPQLKSLLLSRNTQFNSQMEDNLQGKEVQAPISK